MPNKKPTPDTFQTTLPLPLENEEHLDISTLENWLWDAACVIRGATDAPKFKDFILPLIFYKRLSDVFDDEFAKQVEEFGNEELTRDIIKADHEDALKNDRPPIVRFYIPQEYRWEALRNHPADGHLGEFVTDAMRQVARFNPRLQGVNPEPYSTLYDPACGSGGLLIKPRLLFEQNHPDKKGQAPQIYGQELTPTTYAMAKMNAFLHDFIGAEFRIGDTLANPRNAKTRYYSSISPNIS